MIAKETVDKIIETALIEEVVGDFVQLKKRGTSLIGVCPFHNEKTPSFHVSVTKGIYKCFGCGKGGDSVRFVMEHEKYSYPEALKYLANKYRIEIEETEQSPEQLVADDRRESLYIISGWAGKFFQQAMWESDEGKTIGLSYFKERGFREDIVKKFELGYSPDDWDALSSKAVKQGFKDEFLELTGLAIRNDKGKLYDRFRGRVMFPIHNFTGRVIGFGGRTLKSDKNVPKYVNSPESEIYHKSDVLYGLFQAKKTIRDSGNCFLVEGYADVLSMHQAGIENVVASSGTSLTENQTRIIQRLSNSLTILYDGDAAGIKAALKGFSILFKDAAKLALNVVLFPQGHDPDSYFKEYGSSKLTEYIQKNSKDLVQFWIDQIKPDELKDPIKKIKLSDELAEIISNHPDSEIRAVYITKASHRLNIDERRYIGIVNNLFTKKYHEKVPAPLARPTEESAEKEVLKVSDEQLLYPDESQEKEIVRLLLIYGHHLVHWDGITDTYIAPYVITNLSDVEFEHPQSRQIIEEYKGYLEKGELPTEQDFIKHSDPEIGNLSISLVSSPYILSENWYAKRKIYVRNEKENLRATILGGIFHLKKRKVDRILKTIREEIQAENDADNQAILMQRYLRFKDVERGISNFLGSVIVK